MNFYNRESELEELKRIQALSFSDHSRLTVVTGRRRIGKTSLVEERTKRNRHRCLETGKESSRSL